jgi:heme ABC exporter ATP-binding subunit CcmA
MVCPQLEEQKMIVTRALSKIFGLRPVLRGVDLQISAGEWVALFGANGAGKSTLLRLLAGLARPTTGQVLINGLDLAKKGQQVRPLLAYLGHRPLLYPQLTALENLRFFADLYRVPNAEPQCQALLERVNLARFANEATAGFSRGMQQRLALARILIHQPRLLLLDEPWTGLDVQGSELLDAILCERHQAGCTILFTTHDLAHGRALAQRSMVLRGGKLEREGS